ncbi:MAG: discoidin domain-containing protein [Planctomycetota bacterium]
MRRRMIHLVFFVVVLGLARSASALVVSGFQEWNQRTQLADLGGLEITSAGYARFTARVDQDATDVIIHAGGVLETLDTYKLPDGRPQPQVTNVYVYGTWNAHDIESFGVERAAYIYMGPKGEINITSNTDSGARYNPQAWLDEAQLGGRSLLLAPELDPAVWSIQIEDLGGGAYRITAVGPPPGGAAMPTPEDGATYVARDVVLGWTPGPFAPAVNGHLVYLSESFSDVNDGIGGITQSASRYAPPERLAFETTYYWRVDEVNAPPDSTVFPGDVWSFTTEPVGYPIDSANITATASSAGEAKFGPEKTIDGSGLDNDLHSISVTDMWLSGNELQGAWIQYEFDKVYKFHQMWVWNSNQQLEPFLGFGLRDVTVEYSTNGTDWTAVASVPEFARAPGTPGYAHDTTVDFGAVVAKYVKLTATSNWGGVLPQFGLSEVRFFSIPVVAREPSPASGATDVDVNVTLGWRAGREAATHNVSLSTDEQAVVEGTAPAVSVTAD